MSDIRLIDVDRMYEVINEELVGVETISTCHQRENISEVIRDEILDQATVKPDASDREEEKEQISLQLEHVFGKDDAYKDLIATYFDRPKIITAQAVQETVAKEMERMDQGNKESNRD